jgi:hypothetical protein
MAGDVKEGIGIFENVCGSFERERKWVPANALTDSRLW